MRGYLGEMDWLEKLTIERRIFSLKGRAVQESVQEKRQRANHANPESFRGNWNAKSEKPKRGREEKKWAVGVGSEKEQE